jgi:hypothetical protein
VTARELAGEPYDPLDPELPASRERARELLGRCNASARRPWSEPAASSHDVAPGVAVAGNPARPIRSG